MTRRYIRLALDQADGTSLIVWALLLAEAAALYDPAGGQITSPGLQVALHSWLGHPATVLPDALSQLTLPRLAQLTLFLAQLLDDHLRPRPAGAPAAPAARTPADPQG